MIELHSLRGRHPEINDRKAIRQLELLQAAVPHETHSAKACRIRASPEVRGEDPPQQAVTRCSGWLSNTLSGKVHAARRLQLR